MFNVSPLRIAHLNTERTWRGGEAQLLYLARGMKAKGHQQWIIGQPGSPVLSQAKGQGIDTIGLPMPSEWNLRSVWNLARFFRA